MIIIDKRRVKVLKDVIKIRIIAHAEGDERRFVHTMQMPKALMQDKEFNLEAFLQKSLQNSYEHLVRETDKLNEKRQSLN
jgi:replication-associated recombination protein RarA